MIIPPEASIGVQEALRELEQRLAAVEAKADEQDTSAVDALRSDVDKALSAKTYLDEQDIFKGSGVGHLHGLVPNPGSASGLYRVLREDGDWAPELEGIVRVAPAGLGGSAASQRVANVLGSLAVTGGLQADSVMSRSLTMAVPHPASHIQRGGILVNENGITNAINVIVWRAPYACTVRSVKGYRVGGTGATINARLNGSSNHLSSALSLTSADTWMDGGAVQNTAYVAGDKMEIMAVSVTGSPTQVGILIELTVP